MKKYFLLLSFFTALIGKAQNYTLFTSNVPSQNAIELKWYGKKMKLDNAYDLYRKETGGSWQKINSTSMKRANALSKSDMKTKPTEKNTEALYMYSLVMNDTSKSSGKKSLNYFTLISLAINNNELAAVLGIYFQDKNLLAGKIYEYRLVTSGSSADNFLASASIAANSYSQPDAPSGLAREAKEKEVLLKWKYSDKSIGYNIYRYSSSAKADTVLQLLMNDDEIALANSDKFFFNDDDKNLKQGITYKYKVASTDAFGHESKLSNEVTAQLIDLTPPNAVQSLKAEMNADKTVSVKWKPSVSADCSGYNVYRSLKKEDSFQKLNSATLSKTDSLFTDKNVTESTEYFYYVDAIDKSNNVQKSLTVSVVITDLTPPAMPTGLKAVGDTGKIYLSWNANTEKDLMGYYVFRALKSDEGNFNLLMSKPVTENKFMDTLQKQAGNFFVYKICAVDKSWNRSETTPLLFAKQIDLIAPTAPEIRDIATEGNGIKITIGKSPSADIRELEIQRKLTLDTLPEALKKINTNAVAGNAGSYIDERVEKGKAYTYQLIAIDSSGNRSVPSVSRIVSNDLKAGAGYAPAELRVVYDEKTKTANVGWKETATGAVEGYKVYRKTNNGSFVPVSALAKGSSLADTSVEAGNSYSYSYKILAILPTGESKFSTEVKIEIK